MTDQPILIVPVEEIRKEGFDEDLVRKYPRSNRKVQVEIDSYGLKALNDDALRGQTQFISPYGIQFQGQKQFEEGTLLKIQVTIPNYWARKQRFVNYQRIDTPETFKILAKVVRTEDVGKRGKKKITIAQTVNIDEVDEQVLKAYLQDG